jgi:hypothetical protein
MIGGHRLSNEQHCSSQKALAVSSIVEDAGKEVGNVIQTWVAKISEQDSKL